MTDTKKLIEEARKLAEQQREEALIQEAMENSVSPAAPNPSHITPQEAFDETWGAVKKVNENIDAKFTNNSDKLISNNAGTASDQAQIGRAFAGNQFYGYLANNVVVGSGVKGTAQFGCANQAPATVEFATDGSAPITFGTGSTSNITIGSTQTTGVRKIVSGAVEATFDDVIKTTKAQVNIWGGDGTQKASISTMDGSDGNKMLITASRANEIAAYYANQKQDKLTSTLTLHWDDGSKTDIKVG